MLTAHQARKLFSYNKKTGSLRWKVNVGRIKAGALAGHVNGQGYREVMTGEKSYQVSRVIWLMMTGRWPKHEIDHKNRDRSDNRWVNLRHATKSQNLSNCRLYSSSSTGLKGVSLPYKGRYYPYIQVNNKRIRLGGFSCPFEAHRAFVDASKKYRGEFSRSA